MSYGYWMHKLRLAINETFFLLLLLALGAFQFGWVFWPNLGIFWNIASGVLLLGIAFAGFLYKINKKIKRHLFAFSLILALTASFVSGAWMGSLIPYSQSSYENSQEKNDKVKDTDWWGSVINDPMNFFTLLIAGFTGGLLYFSFDLVRQGRETSQRQLRAYLSIVKIKSKPIIDGEAAVIVTIRNCGQTPAFCVTARDGIRFQDINNTEFTLNERKGEVVIGPGVEMSHLYTVTTMHEGTDKQNWAYMVHKKILEKSAALFVFGEIRYRDVFYGTAGNRVERVTGFRAAITGQKAIEGGKMNACADGNYAT